MITIFHGALLEDIQAACRQATPTVVGMPKERLEIAWVHARQRPAPPETNSQN